jgi:hypothetical protein
MLRLYVPNPSYPYQISVLYLDAAGDERACQSRTVINKTQLALSFPCRA